MQAGRELVELHPVLGHEPAKLGRVIRRNLRDLRHHPLDVRRAVQLAARPENQPVLRVELFHRHFAVQIAPGRREDLLENLRVQEKRRPEIKPVAVALEGRRPPANARLSLNHGHVQAGLGQQHRRGQAARAGPYNQHS